VLDLFAGSGVLGFEALSRGAKSAELVDNSALVCAALEATKAALAAAESRVYKADALNHLRGCNQTYDFVFVDPPFNKGLVEPVLEALTSGARLTDNALVYVEQPKHEPLPGDYGVFRDKTFGDSRALLLSPS